MTHNVSLQDLHDAERRLEAELADVRDLIVRMEKFGVRGNGTRHKASRHPARPVRVAPKTNRSAPSSKTATGGPTLRDRVRELVGQNPGITAPDLTNKLIGNVALSSRDPRKLISTRIGQFVKAGTLRREGGKLYVAA